MYQNTNQKVLKGSKVVVGLGDSFTQGVGSWSLDTYKKYNGFIDPLNIPKNLQTAMYEYSWVAQLCREYLTDYIPINLGKMGKGNRASVKELYLNPELEIQNASEVIVVLMLSGIERFDFVNRDFPGDHFVAMWPNPWDKNASHKQLWQAYANDIWSEKFVCLEALLNIKEAETYCKAHGYKLIIASAFDQRLTRDYFIKNVGKLHATLVDTIPWNKFLYPNGCKSFIELLLTYDGRPELAEGAFYDYYSKLKFPTEHITTCMHPTRLGYRIMAEEIYKFAVENQYVKTS